jgi:hypothetical protein
METVFYSFLFVLCASLFMSEGRHPLLPVVTGVLFAFTAMTRPEGALFFGVSLVWLIWTRGVSAWWPRPAVLWSGSFLVVFAAFLAWRYSYYGDFVPNTFYAKSGYGMLSRFKGLKYVFEFTKYYGGAALVFLAMVPFVWRNTARWTAYVAWLCCGYLGYVIWVGGDNMAQYRFMAPILPLLYLLVQEGIKILARLFGEGEQRPVARHPIFWSRVPVMVLTGLMSLYFVTYSVYLYVPISQNIAVNDPLSDADRLVKIGEWLTRIAPEGSTIAVGEAGAIPYATGWRALDGFGLTDRQIAKAPRVRDSRGVMKKDPEFVIRRILEWKPDFVEFGVTRGWDSILGPNEDLLWNALLRHEYVPIPPHDKMGGIVIFCRRGVAEKLALTVSDRRLVRQSRP